VTDTITGFVNGDTSAVVTGTASLTTTATAASELERMQLQRQPALWRRAIHLHVHAWYVTVSKAALTVTAPLSKIYGAAILR